MRRPHRNIEIFSMSALDLFASALGGFVLVAIMLFPYYNKFSQAEAEAQAAVEALEVAEAAKTEAEAAAEESKQAEEEAKAAETEAEAARELAEKQLADSDRERQEAVQLAEEAQRLADVAKKESDEAKIEVAQLVEAQAEQQREIDSLLQQAAKTFLIIVIEWEENFDVDLFVTDPADRTFSPGQTNKTGEKYPGVASQLSVDNRRGPGIEVWQAPDAEPGRYMIRYLLFSPLGRDTEVRGKAFFRNGVIDLPVHTLPTGKETFEFAVEVTQDGSVELVE